MEISGLQSEEGKNSWKDCNFHDIIIIAKKEEILSFAGKVAGYGAAMNTGAYWFRQRQVWHR